MQSYARTNVTGRTKERIAKANGLVLVRSHLLTSHKWRELVSSGRLVCRYNLTSFSGMCLCLKKNQNAPRPSEHPPVRGKNVKTFVLFCFVFVFRLSLKPRPSIQSFFDMQAPLQPACFFLSSFCLWRCRFFWVFFWHHYRFLFLEYAVRLFLPGGVLPYGHVLDFLHR